MKQLGLGSLWNLEAYLVSWLEMHFRKKISMCGKNPDRGRALHWLWVQLVPRWSQIEDLRFKNYIIIMIRFSIFLFQGLGWNQLFFDEECDPAGPNGECSSNIQCLQTQRTQVVFACPLFLRPWASWYSWNWDLDNVWCTAVWDVAIHCCSAMNI